MTKPVLGIDQFSINGIPSDIDAMHDAYPFGWYQITNGLTVNPMAFTAWPVYSKWYGPYHFFDPYPGGNWIYQSWELYAESCAKLFLLIAGEQAKIHSTMVDVEGWISDEALKLKFPNVNSVERRKRGNQLFLKMLKIFCDYVEDKTGLIPVMYSKNTWIMVDGHTAEWAKRLPLCLPTYPYDNYKSQKEYDNALRGIIDGTRKLPPMAVPKPWDRATYIQFTGRAPASFIPGYALEPNWAKTVDLNILVENNYTPPPQPPAQTNYVTKGWISYLYPDYYGPVNKAIGSILGKGIPVVVEEIVNEYAKIISPKSGWTSIQNLV